MAAVAINFDGLAGALARSTAVFTAGLRFTRAGSVLTLLGFFRHNSP